MSARIAAVLLSGSLFLLPALAAAKPWHGIVPGRSTRTEVVKKFGSPDHEEGATPRYASRIVYNAEALKETYGAAEAQFWFDKAGKVQEIYVIPAVDLSRTDVEGAWGKAYKEHRTDDFRLYLHYAAEGFVVFFEKDGKTVYQLVYTEPTAGQPQPPENKPEGKKTSSAKTP